MTLLVRLGEGRGREGCLFHKTVDMHFSTGCFSFTLCSKKKTVSKAEIWVSLQEEKKKKKGLPPCSLQPRPQGGHATLWLSPPQDVLLPRVPTRAKKKKTGLPLRDPRLVCPLVCHGDTAGHEPRGCKPEPHGVLRASPRGETCCCPGLTGRVIAKPVFLLESWRIGFPSKIASVNCFTSQEELCQTAYLPWPHAHLKQSLSDNLAYFWICTLNLGKGRSFASQASKSNLCQTISFIH